MNYTREELIGLNRGDHYKKDYRDFVIGHNDNRNLKNTFLLEWIKPSDRCMILECGCALGKSAILFAQHGSHVYAVDFDRKTIEYAQQQLQKHFGNKLSIMFSCVDLRTCSRQHFPLVNVITMLDFTEHVPDEELEAIFMNLRRFNAELYILTPNRNHWMEVLKHWNIVQNERAHINVKTSRELEKFLDKCGWKVIERRWLTSYWYIRYMEEILGRLPFIGTVFQKKIAIKARSKKYVWN